MAPRGHPIVVIGTSAGGLEALDRVIGGLPPDLPASIFIVQHMAPESDAGVLVDRLSRHKNFDCRLARNGETFRQGRLYVAPADYHLLVKKGTLLVTKGARENRYRPAIDPLFRSAAVAHGSGVIGVVLTGLLDDGTAGLLAIHKCGGVTVVQDPGDAAYPDMPQSALNHLKVDHCVPAAEMGALLAELVRRPASRKKAVPEDIRTEARIAERVLSDVAQVEGLGSQVPYNCPNCSGPLWLMDSPGIQRYRCHTGHSFTASALLTGQSEKIEEALWICLRMLEERKNLLNNLVQKETRPEARRSYADRLKEAEGHAESVRNLLLVRSDGKPGTASNV